MADDNQNPPDAPDFGTILPRAIVEEMTTSYMDYAMSVIISRALPDVRDGLKPVHRRILHSMEENGIRSNTQHKKSARVVGEVLGKYHPHSDQAVYDSLVRMAQDFSMRYPLVDGHGNFGSVDGDPPAAMRYTECRMTRVAEELLAEIDRNTVDFVDNYDASEREPTILPGKFPNLLCNGSSGIAVGMTTNIPPHNLGEIAAAIKLLIENPDADTEELMRIVPGPDFPTGGTIIGVDGIRNAYATGHGRVVIRARTTYEEANNGRARIIVEELPYQVNKANLIGRIAELVSDRKIEGIADLNDESDRSGMRIVIELKREARVASVLNNLFKHTQLQATFGVIMLALVDGRPQILTLKRMLQSYIDHRQIVITRRTQHDLDQARERAHILEGLKICLDHLDEVIATIRASADPETAGNQLQAKFGLSERQAKAILEMRLQRLTQLERGKIEAEYEEVIKLIAYLEDILANPSKVLALIRDELDELVKKYGDHRRTHIEAEASAEIRDEDLVQREDVVITMTNRGYIKRQPLRVFRQQRRGGRGKLGARTVEGQEAPTGEVERDYAEHLLVANTHDHLLFFTDRGRVLRIFAHQVKDVSRHAAGIVIGGLIDLDRDEKVTAIVPLPRRLETDAGAYMVMATRKGFIKKTPVKEYANVQSNGKIAISLRAGDELGWVHLSSGEDDIMIATRDGKAARFSEKEVRPMGRDTMGTTGMRLRGTDEVRGMEVVRPESKVLVITERGYGKRTPVEDYPVKHRATQGVFTLKVTDKVGRLAAMRQVFGEDEEIMLITEKGIVLRTSVSSISIYGRQTQGVTVMKVPANDRLTAVARLEATDDTDEEMIPTAPTGIQLHFEQPVPVAVGDADEDFPEDPEDDEEPPDD
ncbi:MAG: DNA gyrase subunit A [Candidatus Dormibacteria bacterium]